jgi:EAL domain-containing protein (putative c-di-GMP-specific phosphodiesterase class I)
VIKIHNSFVASMITNSRDRAACGAMIEMAHRLGRKVIAEGVESYEQAELLKRQGCDYLQGFLYSKPVHAEELAQLLDLEVNG